MEYFGYALGKEDNCALWVPKKKKKKIIDTSMGHNYKIIGNSVYK